MEPPDVLGDQVSSKAFEVVAVWQQYQSQGYKRNNQELPSQAGAFRNLLISY